MVIIVSMVIHVLITLFVASYDSTSSVPTVDMSSEMYNHIRDQPINPPRIAPTPFPTPKPVHSSTDDPFTSPAAPRVS